MDEKKSKDIRCDVASAIVTWAIQTDRLHYATVKMAVIIDGVLRDHLEDEG